MSSAPRVDDPAPAFAGHGDAHRPQGGGGRCEVAAVAEAVDAAAAGRHRRQHQRTV
jgi:hypothetical protein